MKTLIEESSKIRTGDNYRSFVSSDDPDRIEIAYYFNKNNNHVYASVHFGHLSQGPPGFVHGGAMASVLDETMGITSWINDFKVLTKSLTVNYHKALKLKTSAYVDSWIDFKDEKNINVKSILLSKDGKTVYADGQAVFVALDKNKWKSLGINTSKFISEDYLEE